MSATRLDPFPCDSKSNGSTHRLSRSGNRNLSKVPTEKFSVHETFLDYLGLLSLEDPWVWRVRLDSSPTQIHDPAVRTLTERPGVLPTEHSNCHRSEIRVHSRLVLHPILPP